MNKGLVLGGAALLALAGCNFSVGTNSDENVSGSIVNAPAPGNAQAQAAPAPGGGSNTGSSTFAGLNPSGGAAAPSGSKDPAAIPVGAPGGARIQPSLLVGRWADDEECKLDILFRPDGTFRSYTGGEGRWSVAGDVLTFTGSAGTFRLRLQSFDGNVMVTVNEQGTTGRSRRC